jgi:SNF2 family DNA or RNA helicase
LGLGVCLADDMGLGKTIQIITLLLQIKYNDPKRNKKSKTKMPALLILPTSLLGNWQREIERFAPELRLKILHRSVTDAKTMATVAADPQVELADVDIVATTYGLARREKWLADVRWRLVVLDEAQAIKNAAAAQTKSIKAIPCDGRIALTGTPVENHLGDLWSLFDFCLPGLLGTTAQFKKFTKADDPKALSRRLASLRQLIQPYVLRRMKTDPQIVGDLPEKTEMRVDCGLTQTQATLYRVITKELEDSLNLAAGIQRRGMVLAALMQLKQICNHPALYLKQAEFLPKHSAKYSELAAICETVIEKQEKVLVFTQFQSMCQPLADFLAEVFGRKGLVLTGKTAAKRRGKIVDEFQKSDGPPFFVISVKAGGTGLNLTEASHVIHFDRWWNPAVEDQATDRAFRIGQKRNVLVHKFVCRGTLEERIDDMIRAKKQLSEELFDGEGQIQLTEMTNQQLMQFISLDAAKASTT